MIKTNELRAIEKKLKREIAQLDKTRRMYVLQSEWHRMMYSHTLQLEMVASLLGRVEE